MRHLRRLIQRVRATKPQGAAVSSPPSKIIGRRGDRALKLIGFAALILTSIVAVLFLWPMPDSLDQAVPGTPVLLDLRGREIAELPSAEARVQLPRQLNEISPWLTRVVVALEDHRFYEHGAIDWRATAAAFSRNVRSGRIISGGSTITQQLAKIGRGRQHRSWLGKIDETIVAWKLERRWDKERILTEYLNRSSYGNRRLGPEAAARAYFGKSARDLSLAESIYLAGLPQAPTRFNPWRHADVANRRYSRSLTRLSQLNVITEAQRDLLTASAPVVGRFTPPRLAPHFVDAVTARYRGLHGVVRTSLDLDLQATAERLVHEHLTALNRFDIAEAALVIVDNETGAVRALVGSGDYTSAQTNGATIPRSCGSTLKPFVYLHALDRKVLTAASILPDTPDAIRDAYADYDPQNYNHHYLGPVRVREALACSLNVPAVFTVSRLGARPVFFQLQKWGFRFPKQLDDYGAGFVLGNAEIRLTDLAGAYAGLARHGVAASARFLASEYHPFNRIASREATAIITDILSDNIAREKTFGAQSPLAFDRPIAVKTGTSSGFRDAWTVGFNKQHTVAVWVGNFDSRPMRDTFAVRSASPLWAMVMRELLHRGDEPIEPPHENEQLVRREICAVTGLLPSRLTTARMSEWFLRGTEPVEDSARSFSADGKLLLPPEYAVWCASGSNTSGATVRPEPRIINPVANAHYTIDRDLPRAQQMIELNATLGRDVRWFVNDTALAPQADGRYFWALTPGEWKLRARGSSANLEQTITVE